MKNLILFTLVLTISATTFATVRTVSNNAYSPGQYTNLQIAIDSANNGDTIYVEPSPTDYGSITINKQLFIFGGGGSPYTYQFNYTTRVDNVTFSNNTSFPQSTSNGSTFQGFYAYDAVTVNSGLKNITISRLLMDDDIAINANDTGILVTNCVFNGYNLSISGSGGNDIEAIVANNFFYTAPIACNGVAESNVIITNNIFYGTSNSTSNQNTFFSSGNNLQVRNNIYYCDGGSATTFASGCSGCTFNNNLTYSPNTTQTLPDGTNTGTGNYNNVNPNFVSGPAVYTALTVSPGTTYNLYNYNWNLQSNTTYLGTDATDIGIYGGAYPFNNFETVTKLPQVRFINIYNPSVAPGSTLNVNVIGTTRN